MDYSRVITIGLAILIWCYALLGKLVITRRWDEKLRLEWLDGTVKGLLIWAILLWMLSS